MVMELPKSDVRTRGTWAVAAGAASMGAAAFLVAFGLVTWGFTVLGFLTPVGFLGLSAALALGDLAGWALGAALAWGAQLTHKSAAPVRALAAALGFAHPLLLHPSASGTDAA